MDLDPFKHKANNDDDDDNDDVKYIMSPPWGNFEESDFSEKGFSNPNVNFKGGSKGLIITSNQGYEDSEELKTDSQFIQDPSASTLDTNRTTSDSNVQKGESSNNALNFNNGDQEIVTSQRKSEGDPTKTKECQKTFPKKSLAKTEYRNESTNVYRYVTNLISGKNKKSPLSQKLEDKFGNEKPKINQQRLENYLKEKKSVNYFTDYEDRPKKEEILYWVLATILGLKVASFDDEKDNKGSVQIEEESNNIYLEEYYKCKKNTKSKEDIKKVECREKLRDTFLQILTALCSKSIELGLKDECQNILKKFGFDMGIGEQMEELTSRNQHHEETNNSSSCNKPCIRKVQLITNNYQFGFTASQQTIKISFNALGQKPTQNTHKIATLQGLNSLSNLKFWTDNPPGNEVLFTSDTYKDMTNLEVDESSLIEEMYR